MISTTFPVIAAGVNMRSMKLLIASTALEGGLTSRAQTKSLAASLEGVSEAELDFKDVDGIGQAFADELLRVWPLHHPETRLRLTNANPHVLQMAKHVQGRKDLPQPTNEVLVT